jgi:hypothetical protein
MDRNSSSRREFLSDSEVAKRLAPGGRLRLASGGKAADPRGDKQYEPISSGSAAATAGQALHEFKRARPDLKSRREREGK